MSRYYCVWQLPFMFKYVHGKQEYYINVKYILQTSLREFYVEKHTIIIIAIFVLKVLWIMEKWIIIRLIELVLS